MKIQVQVFDEEHEEDLQDDINEFLAEMDPHAFIDVRFSVAAFSSPASEQIYCYSALIIFRDEKK